MVMKRVFIKTYGCQMNERDSELVAHDLVQNGYELVNNESGADIVLLNTCSVREQAEKKAIGKANNLLSKRKKKPSGNTWNSRMYGPKSRQ
jgi:tRNA-2-methylthio-N6-dimethylallyladenosine synthase